MRVASTFEDVRTAAADSSLSLVPTMGSLHAGHVSLLDIGRQRADTVVMSVFVNPLQFDDPADLERYPRDLDRDLALAEEAGIDIVFAPSAEEMYPRDPTTRVVVSDVSDEMEGAHRPGHFTGVATVVTKLFAGLQPDVAVFGRKDAQQLALVTRLARDLSFPLEVVGAPTVRESDGLAMSSRNMFLQGDDRRTASSLSAGLFAAADHVEAGGRDARELEQIVAEWITDSGGEVEYVTLADAVEAVSIAEVDRPAFLAVAATVGAVRLIDNVFMWPDGTVDRGLVLDEEEA